MEVIFTIMNQDKVLENDEDLIVRFHVNDIFDWDKDETYLLQVYNKREIMY